MLKSLIVQNIDPISAVSAPKHLCLNITFGPMNGVIALWLTLLMLRPAKAKIPLTARLLSTPRPAAQALTLNFAISVRTATLPSVHPVTPSSIFI
ncbi:hypothetical protein BOTBODRAFT_513046 [Botryobasidium botryosum FD-172 SS1]|uniref:Uncharacterized protein n=1 Tax=Botryobasidium botryosum (strain FD-172 SS1) TaxID=930990 RepID=A0A067MUV8_BOTB1|nr:hypothetical protein BOTBODRAFT_513046 [Botryobasidium botryosum FD-172 SS1]